MKDLIGRDAHDGLYSLRNVCLCVSLEILYTYSYKEPRAIRKIDFTNFSSLARSYINSPRLREHELKQSALSLSLSLSLSLFLGPYSVTFSP